MGGLVSCLHSTAEAAVNMCVEKIKLGFKEDHIRDTELAAKTHGLSISTTIVGK